LNESANHGLDSVHTSMICCGMHTFAHERLVISTTCTA
jgi:hypothetical protein